MKDREVPKAKDCKTDATSTSPLYLPLPEYSQSTNPLSELPFHSGETTRTQTKSAKLVALKQQ